MLLYNKNWTDRKITYNYLTCPKKKFKKLYLFLKFIKL